MVKAQILSEWVGDGLLNPKRPRFSDDYPEATAHDITEQESAPPPGVLVIEVYSDDSLFAIIESDSNYVILMSEEILDETT
jgi:hypothetical protein